MKIIRKLTLGIALLGLNRRGRRRRVRRSDKTRVERVDRSAHHDLYRWRKHSKRLGYNVEYVTAGYYPQMQALTDNSNHRDTRTLELQHR